MQSYKNLVGTHSQLAMMHAQAGKAGTAVSCALRIRASNAGYRNAGSIAA